MIIHTGNRTDIPAFYTPWFIRRIQEGYVYVRNPYYPKLVTRYRLDPKVVDSLEFCTKNPEPMLPYLDLLKDFRLFWFVTITPYGKDIECHVPCDEQVIQSFQRLSRQCGIEAVGWRYDPIFFNENFHLQEHIQAFEIMAKQLKGYTHQCVISFLDLYEKVKRNAPDLKVPTKQEQIEIAKAFVKIGKENDMSIYACCEDAFLEAYGVDCLGCRRQSLVEKSVGYPLQPPKIKNVKRSCQCLLGQDIGAYDTCGHLCRYCYANTSKKRVMENMQKHDPTSPLLIGHIEKDDIIVEAKQESYRVDWQQMTLF